MKPLIILLLLSGCAPQTQLTAPPKKSTYINWQISNFDCKSIIESDSSYTVCNRKGTLNFSTTNIYKEKP